jgi:DNA-binding XRE family transcriptional regulator
MSRRPKEEQPLLVENAVEQLRSAAGFSRQELAEKVGVHYQTIGYIERGEYSPSLLLAIQIAKTLGQSMEDVFWIKEWSKNGK